MPNINTRKISEIMDRKLVAISNTTTIRSALNLVKTSNFGIIPVLANGRLVGMVDETELLLFAASHKEEDHSVGVDRLIKSPIFVEQNDTIATAIKTALDHDMQRLPVVDSLAGMRCVGLISTTELLKEAAGK